MHVGPGGFRRLQYKAKTVTADWQVRGSGYMRMCTWGLLAPLDPVSCCCIQAQVWLPRPTFLWERLQNSGLPHTLASRLRPRCSPPARQRSPGAGAAGTPWPVCKSACGSIG